MAIGGFQEKQVSRAISSAFDSVAEGISNVNQTAGKAALQKAVSSFEIAQTSDNFSSIASPELRQTVKISSPGQIKSPHSFFSELSSGKYQPASGKSELAEKILNPDLKLQRGIQELGKTFQEEIRKFEEKLNTIGDDAQLANVDMQNVLQQLQQVLQLMSNFSKMEHDNAMSIIRNLKA